MRQMTWQDWNPYRGIPFWVIVAAGGICLFFYIMYELYARNSNHSCNCNRSRSHGAWLAIALFYTFTILCATYFGREPSEQQEVRWHLFWTFEAALRTGNWIYWYYIFGNILLFVPFGFILSHVYMGRWSIVRSALLCLLFSCLIEAAQYITGTGLCELDDVFHNGLGGLMGAVIAGGLRWIKGEK